MDSYDTYDDLIIIMFYVLDDNDEKVVVKIILQVPWIMMFINDKKINGNVSGFMDPESHTPNRALQWQRHLHLRLQGLLLVLLSMIMMDKVMLMVMIIIMLMMATSPSRQTPGQRGRGSCARSAALKPPSGRTDLTILLWRNPGQAADVEIPTGLQTFFF